MAKGTRKTLTADDYKAKLEKARAAYKALEQKAYATELDALIKGQNIVAAINAIKTSTKDISDIAILTAIGKASGIKNFVITQTEVKKRKPKAK
ncbi:MAG: hypothetical protein B7Y55_00975 [Polynucleobacter sp. 35-46-207]|jgi:hypothetical protein|nr:MAG: hypothetical protein B7Y55_00975 [Polynucleobacter sp. 35-46-207]OZB48843.1 MAG: hypothetical protein B7X60_02935 [Polynucleobacter sp. 39-45-136]